MIEKIEEVLIPDELDKQKEMEEINAAYLEEEVATGKFFGGEITLDEYIDVLKRSVPLSENDAQVLVEIIERRRIDRVRKLMVAKRNKVCARKK